MKKLFIAGMVLVSTVTFSQTATVSRKYNESLSRYEYYNSDGDLIGYSKWNPTTRTYDLYEVERQPVYRRERDISSDKAFYEDQLRSRYPQYNGGYNNDLPTVSRSRR